jgi:DNA polymerase III alpha subunit
MASHLQEIGQTKCAITDHASLSAIYPAYTSFKKKGIQLLPGCEFYIVPHMEETKGMNNHLVVIAKNKIGWENILKMNYIAYAKGPKSVFDRLVGRIEMSVLEEHKEGLLVSSACLAGIPAWYMKTEREEEAIEHVKQMQKLFPESYFLEVQGVDFYDQLDSSHKTSLIDKEWIEQQAKDQKAANDRMIALAHKLKIPIVCTTDSHYINKEDRESHLLMLAIQSKTNIQQSAVGRGGRLAFEATPMLSTENLIKMFAETESGFNGYAHDQIQQWIKNTQLAGDLCEPATYLEPSGYKMPPFPFEQSNDYSKFLEWKSSLNKEEIEGIIEANTDTLKTRLSIHGEY